MINNLQDTIGRLLETGAELGTRLPLISVTLWPMLTVQETFHARLGLLFKVSIRPFIKLLVIF